MTDDGLRELLDFLLSSRGVDLNAYKPASLTRRLQRRMDAVGAKSFGEYRDHLELDRDEFRKLMDVVLINVTAFFRDATAWEYLAGHVVGPILAAQPPGGCVRVWSAGCASGEEAYSVAMLVAAALGEVSLARRLRVYGTDLDDDALAQARAGLYSAKAVADVPDDLRQRYLHETEAGWRVSAEVRRAVIFGRHDMLEDAPISRLDLLVCRNTLIYFNSEAQAKILSRFDFALNPGGFLFLGKAETLVNRDLRFAADSAKHRVYRKQPGYRPDPEPVGAKPAIRRRLALQAALDVVPLAVIVLDTDQVLIEANRTAIDLFGLETADIGHPFPSSEDGGSPPELRAAVQEVLSRGVSRRPQEIEWTTSAGKVLVLDAYLSPLLDQAGLIIGVGLAVRDVTHERGIARELARTRLEREAANEEFQAINEELQSTNEELETTNEELQSTNEELETLNEEVQATNEELESVNEELRLRTNETRRANAFLESIMSSIAMGVIVVDQECVVTGWNDASQELWGLRPSEAVGTRLSDLDIGLPTGELAEAVSACLQGGPGEEVVVEAVNRRGRRFDCALRVAPLVEHDHRRGAILLVGAATNAD